jgi:hypothetical protein
MRRLALVLLVAGCQPSLGPPLSLVDAARVVAVRAEPAEALPGASVTLTPLVVSPAGTVAQPRLDWSLCLAPKPTTENDVVSAACLQAGGTTPVARGVAAPTIALPSSACRLFGPDLPPEVAGAPAPRARAPDATGGYYQPFVIDFSSRLSDGRSSMPTIALERIRCGLAGASMALAVAFSLQYTPNRNPTLTPLGASVAGHAVALDQIPRGAVVNFTVGWSADSPERYPVLDPLAQTLISHREAIRVAWLASDGAFHDEETGRGEDDVLLDSANAWQAPARATIVHLWIVLRDSRGGVDFASYDLTVR